jgi:F0F1-type ATP synthase assembly protein I
MVVGNKKFGVVSHLVGGSGGILPQKIFVFFYPYD